MYSRSPSRSVTPANGEEGPSKKNRRDRVPVSCTECHRRKKKCDRAQPCLECRERGKSSECRYLVPLITNNEGVAQAARSRVTNRRRFTTKQNVNISLESVQSLVNSSREGSMVPGGWNTDGERDAHGILTPAGFLHPGLESSRESMMPAEFWGHGMSSIGNTVDSVMMDSGFDTPNFEANGWQTAPAFEVPNRDQGDAHYEWPGAEGKPMSPVEPLSKDYLINFFVDLTARKSIPPEESWLEYAMKHPPLFSATLFVSAVHLHRENQLADPSALYYYRHQTIRLANEVMKRGTVEEKTSDEMIMVAVILLYFSIAPNVGWKEYEIHLRGIQQMIVIRGGIEMLNMDGIVGGWLHRIFGPWSEGFEYDHFREALAEEEREEQEEAAKIKI